MFQLSCAARSVFRFFALILGPPFSGKNKRGRVQAPARAASLLKTCCQLNLQAAFSARIRCAVELSTLKVPTTGSASSRCRTISWMAGYCSRWYVRHLPWCSKSSRPRSDWVLHPIPEGSHPRTRVVSSNRQHFLVDGVGEFPGLSRFRCYFDSSCKHGKRSFRLVRRVKGTSRSLRGDH